MGWSFRKSLSLLPGIRINLSKSGPRLSVGVPGARASINMQGEVRVYGEGPIRYQKAALIGKTDNSPRGRKGLFSSLIRRILGAQ
jgi:hypothetical protein